MSVASVAEVGALALRPVASDQLTATVSRDDLYRVAWTPVPAPATTANFAPSLIPSTCAAR